MLAYGTMKAALHLHHSFVNRIMHAPQHFFDCCPKGRIISRCSSDIDIIDYRLPMILKQMIMLFFRVGAKQKL